VRLARPAVWTVIAAGPIACCVAVASTPATVEAATPDKPTTLRTAVVAADPGGYARMFVHAWLRSRADDARSAQARLAQSLAPGVELPDPAAGAQPAACVRDGGAQCTARERCVVGDGGCAVRRRAGALLRRANCCRRRGRFVHGDRCAPAWLVRPGPR
jgi:hypothetical protein